MELQDNIISEILRHVSSEFDEKPPTIGVVGVSGVGKSSTINAMFSTSLATSATVRGTHRFSTSKFDLGGRKFRDRHYNGFLQVIDAPGLGEDIRLDRSYLEKYRRHLPRCDAILWVLTARNRAAALDQSYLQELSDFIPRMVLAINQADLVDPLNWDEQLNLPSDEQLKNLTVICKDRKERISAFFNHDFPSVIYSAKKYYKLQELYAKLIESAPPSRRWMFEMIKSFSTHDWLNQAQGLSEDQKAEFAKKHLRSKGGSFLTMDTLLNIAGISKKN